MPFIIRCGGFLGQIDLFWDLFFLLLAFVMDKVHKVLYKCCYFQLFDCRVLDYDKFILFFKVHPISSLGHNTAIIATFMFISTFIFVLSDF